MLLNEFIYFDSEPSDMYDRSRYEPEYDISVIKTGDLRKSRLTLKMLNRLRKAGDARERENAEELELVRTMYAPPKEEAAPGGGMPPMM